MKFNKSREFDIIGTVLTEFEDAEVGASITPFVL